jgi:hypothetical protein
MELLLGLVLIFLLIVLSNVAERNHAWLPLHVLSLLGFCLLWAGFGLFVLLLPALPLTFLAEDHPPTSVGLAFLSSALAGALLLFSPVRRVLSRWLPIRADSPVHTTALLLALFLIAWSAVNLLWLGGVEGMQQAAESVPLGLLAVQAIGLILFAVLGVGFPIRRTWVETVDRLGLHRLKKSDWWVASTAVAVLLIINVTITGIWLLVAPEQAEAHGHISDQIFGN